MAIYKSTKSVYLLILAKYVPYTVYTIMLLALIREYAMSSDGSVKLLWSIIILAIMFGGLIWFVEKLLQTNYTIDGEVLRVDSGIAKREISISTIQSLSPSSHAMYGYKPGLGSNGYKMIYESGRMMYISPDQSDRFLKELKSVNEKIIIQ